MAESTLSLDRTQLRQAIGMFAGMGPTVSEYSENELTQIDLCLDIGLRSFYDPMIMPGESAKHEWSFMTPIGSLPLTADQIDYDMPDDFGHFTDSRLYMSADSEAWHEIRLVAVSRILALRQRDTSSASGPTQFAALTAVNTSGVTPTRERLMIWPPPDSSSYVLRFEYRSNPYQLTAGQKYPLGGQPHAETIREACLAAWEREVDGQEGVHSRQFMLRLQTSIATDRRVTGPETLGYNGDRSSSPRAFERWNRNVVTINGITPA
jgi:hypothetical protein